ncbi:MAG: excisionase family DNA-binding protein [Ahniella sp.]|nr:excisionase family DNA-binding protein [Ahniella sp.]
MAKVAHRCISESLDRARAVSIQVTSSDGDLPSVSVPTAALRLFGEVLAALSERKVVTVIPGNREMTTLEAANFLNVSRPFLIREIDAGKLPLSRKVGSHRRILFEDLMAYKRASQAGREEALERMSKNAIEIGLDF